MSKPIITKSENYNEEKRQKIKSEISELHKKYKTMHSNNLHNLFNKDNKKEWKKYHEISKENEYSFPEEAIPRNMIIKELENLQGKRRKEIVDLGCGYGEISEYFKNNDRFHFNNFDHVSINDNIISRDIRKTELDEFSIDIAIMCLSMWGSNCKDYITEVYRILDNGGTLYIIEPYKRWNKEENKNNLIDLLIENNFNIIKYTEQKFMFIECRK